MFASVRLRQWRYLRRFIKAVSREQPRGCKATGGRRPGRFDFGETQWGPTRRFVVEVLGRELGLTATEPGEEDHGGVPIWDCRCAKSFLNNRSDFRSPTSVRTTDLALPTGSDKKPFRWSRFMVSQSNPFHALVPSCSVKWRSARTASSIFLVSISMRAHRSRGIAVLGYVHIWIGMVD